MSGKASAPESAINYGQIEEGELRKHVVDILVNAASGFSDPDGEKRALKADFLNLKRNEVSEAYVRALGFSTTNTDGTLKEKIPLTWRLRNKKSKRMDFYIVAVNKYDLVLGEDACFKLAESALSFAPCMINKGAKGNYRHQDNVFDRGSADRVQKRRVVWPRRSDAFRNNNASHARKSSKRNRTCCRSSRAVPSDHMPRKLEKDSIIGILKSLWDGCCILRATTLRLPSDWRLICLTVALLGWPVSLSLAALFSAFTAHAH